MYYHDKIVSGTSCKLARQDYSEGWLALPDDDQIVRRFCCALEWWTHEAEIEMAHRALLGDDGSPPQFPVNMQVVVEGAARTYTGTYLHRGEGLEIDAQHVSRHVCAGCNRRFDRRLRACSRCLVVYYCSRDCQRAHWRTHRETCAPPEHNVVSSLILDGHVSDGESD